jgi:hypothetical protein
MSGSVAEWPLKMAEFQIMLFPGQDHEGNAAACAFVEALSKGSSMTVTVIPSHEVRALFD